MRNDNKNNTHLTANVNYFKNILGTRLIFDNQRFVWYIIVVAITIAVMFAVLEIIPIFSEFAEKNQGPRFLQ